MSDIEKFFESMREFFKKIFEGLAKTFKALIKKMEESGALEAFYNAALEIAMQEILSLDEMVDWTNDDKRDTAFRNIGDRLTALGISFTENMLRKLIEDVVWDIRNK